MKKITYLFLILILAACSRKQTIPVSGEQYGMNEVNASNAEVLNEGRGVYKIGNPYEINGIWYYPKEDYSYVAEGIASWYGPDFHNGITANGEKYDMHALTAAHPTLPLPSIARVTNMENGRALIVRINDRGPFANDRIIDVSKRAAQLLGFHDQGTTQVKIEVLAEQSKSLKDEMLSQGLVSNIGLNSQTVDNRPIKPIYEPVKVQENKPTNIIKSETKPATTTVLPKGFYVQVGAYGKYDNAKKVEDAFKVIANSYVYQIPSNKDLYRVRLGPFTSHGEAASVLEKVKNKGYKDALVVEESKPLNASLGQRFEESMQ